MRRVLQLHPDFRCAAVERIEIEIARAGSALQLDYLVVGDIGALELPSASAPERADELWKRTCFEAFVRPQPGQAYLEFNLAPSTRWAAYAFDGYRQGMRNADVPIPGIAVERGARAFALHATLAVPESAFLLGLSAVIEERGGARSYWALAHPQGKPDFHHSDCFALELPAA
jgi:hypothetical protein